MPSLYGGSGCTKQAGSAVRERSNRLLQLVNRSNLTSYLQPNLSPTVR